MLSKRWITLIFFTTSLIINLSAQIVEEDTTTHQPFFKARKFSSRCYADFEAMPAEVLINKAGFFAGAGLNWVINHKYVVTARYSGLTTPTDIQTIVSPDHPSTINLTYQSAGLGFSYILFSDKLFSFQPELLAGWGGIKFSADSNNYRKNFAEMVPAVYGVCNATRYFRVGIGLNYRLALDANINGLKGNDLSGFSGVVFIRVGTF